MEWLPRVPLVCARSCDPSLVLAGKCRTPRRGCAAGGLVRGCAGKLAPHDAARAVGRGDPMSATSPHLAVGPSQRVWFNPFFDLLGILVSLSAFVSVFFFFFSS